jgi:hypothetical protein
LMATPSTCGAFCPGVGRSPFGIESIRFLRFLAAGVVEVVVHPLWWMRL